MCWGQGVRDRIAYPLWVWGEGCRAALHGKVLRGLALREKKWKVLVFT